MAVCLCACGWVCVGAGICCHVPVPLLILQLGNHHRMNAPSWIMYRRPLGRPLGHRTAYQNHDKCVFDSKIGGYMDKQQFGSTQCKTKMYLFLCCGSACHGTHVHLHYWLMKILWLPRSLFGIYQTIKCVFIFVSDFLFANKWECNAMSLFPFLSLSLSYFLFCARWARLEDNRRLNRLTQHRTRWNASTSISQPYHLFWKLGRQCICFWWFDNYFDAAGLDSSNCFIHFSS